MKNKTLVEFTDDELYNALKGSVENVIYSPANYREEMFRRSQDRNTKALNRWTFVIALATLINGLATLALVLKNFGFLF